MVQLVPEPLPASSTADQELDITLDENTEPEAEVENGSGSCEQETPAEGEEKHHMGHFDCGLVVLLSPFC